MDDDAFKSRLLPGERIVWTGRPRQGVIFTSQDVFLIPFSLLWCGFAIFWTVLATGAVFAVGTKAAWFPLFGLMFVCVGLYLVAGRFGVDAWIRGRIQYALTDRRALISRAGPFADFTAVYLDRSPDATLSERGNGNGTIRFGQPASMWGSRGFSSWSPALDPTPQFLAISDARHVFDLVQRSASVQT